MVTKLHLTLEQNALLERMSKTSRNKVVRPHVFVPEPILTAEALMRDSNLTGFDKEEAFAALSELEQERYNGMRSEAMQPPWEIHAI